MLRTLMLLCCLFPMLTFAFSKGCPSLSEIKRTSGEFSWESINPGWTGHFAYPMQAKGHSTTLTGFIEARWIQLNNLEDAPGYFECDYHGNYDGEVIRFVQAGTRAQKKPTDIHWYCNLNPQFPGVQCLCSTSPEMCLLEAADNTPTPTPIHINPEAHNSLPSLEYHDK